MVIKTIINILTESVRLWLIWLIIVSIGLTAINYARVMMGDILVYGGLVAVLVLLTLSKIME